MLNALERVARRRPSLRILRWLHRGLAGNRVRCARGAVCDVSRGFLYGCDIQVRGGGARLVLGEGVHLENVTILIEGDGCLVELGEDARWDGGALLCSGVGSMIVIGEGSTAIRADVAAGEGTGVRIGRDCMFAYDVDIRSSDSHALVDTATGERINAAADVVVGDHVWRAVGAQVLKGVTIGGGSVVAARAVVTHDVAEGVVVAGNPARVVREGVAWQRPV